MPAGRRAQQLPTNFRELRGNFAELDSGRILDNEISNRLINNDLRRFFRTVGRVRGVEIGFVRGKFGESRNGSLSATGSVFRTHAPGPAAGRTGSRMNLWHPTIDRGSRRGPRAWSWTRWVMDGAGRA